jgi:hypothetical protein
MAFAPWQPPERRPPPKSKRKSPAAVDDNDLNDCTNSASQHSGARQNPAVLHGRETWDDRFLEGSR